MNCKEGDIVVHKGGIMGVNSRNLGKIFRIGKYLGEIEGWEGKRWRIIDGTLLFSTSGKLIDHANDAWLMPIRDPGDDAQDETLTWLEVPNKETA